jgi:hypothetical protein
MSNANIAQYQVPPQNFAPQMQMQMQMPIQINTQQGLGARSGVYGRRQQMATENKNLPAVFNDD